MASKSEVLEEEILSVGPASPVEMQPVEKKLNRDTAKYAFADYLMLKLVPTPIGSFVNKFRTKSLRSF